MTGREATSRAVDCLLKADAYIGIFGDQCTLNVIRDARYKYVHFIALPPLFFDLERDPWEFEDRANDPDYQGLVLDYAQRMLSWRMTHDERLMTNWKLTPEGVVRQDGRRW